MSGARSITQDESGLLMESMERERDRLLLLAGQHLGLRITELLSLTVKQVANGLIPKSAITIARRQLKGGRSGRKGVHGRTIPVHADLGSAIANYLASFPGGLPDPESYLFQSRKGVNRPLSYKSAWRLLTDAAERAGLDTDRLSTHSMRKTFAREMYEASGNDLRMTQALLGHRDIQTTVKYLEPEQDKMAALVKGMASRAKLCAAATVTPASHAALLAMADKPAAPAQLEA